MSHKGVMDSEVQPQIEEEILPAELEHPCVPAFGLHRPGPHLLGVDGPRRHAGRKAHETPVEIDREIGGTGVPRDEARGGRVGQLVVECSVPGDVPVAEGR